MKAKTLPLPSQEFLKENFFYDPDTGAFHRRCPLTKVVLPKNFSLSRRNNYRAILIGRTAYAVHRLAYVYSHGDIPDGYQVDHADCDRRNNKADNLRLANYRQQMANRPRRKDNQTGFKGVSYDYQKRKFCARIREQDRRVNLGWFTTAEEAHAAYCKASAVVHGEFARVV
jgi:hypothetical protein